MPRRIQGSTPRTPAAPTGPAAPRQPSTAHTPTGRADAFGTPAAAPPTSGAPGDFDALVDSLKPKVHAPSGFAARFEAHDRRGAALVDGLGEVPLPRGDSTQPGFTAEAGKPFTVTVDPQRVFESAAKVEVVWRMAPNGDEHAIPISDGARTADGRLKLSPATFDVPADAVGTMRLSIRTTDARGGVSTAWDPTYDARVAPAGAGATLVFTDDWKAHLDTPLRAGEKLRIAYDADRASALFGGQPAQNVTAMVRINGGTPQEYPLTLKDGSLVMPTVVLPFEATDVDVWFKGERDGAANYDSAFGKNYHFDVGTTRDDADPSWKAYLLRSPGFPNLKNDDFAAIGPFSQRYNCIAWTVGVRDEWVWPGDTVQAFDALYAKSGYRPLDSLDARLDPGLEKVVIYGFERPGGRVEVTHGAKQQADGKWTSKLGTEPLIRHTSLEALNGPSYGKPVRVYARPRQEVVS